MYSDKDTVQMYLYNFEGDNYRGRQYAPPVGRLHNEPIEEKLAKSESKTEPIAEVKEEITGKTEPVKKVSRKSKKK